MHRSSEMGSIVIPVSIDPFESVLPSLLNESITVGIARTFSERELWKAKEYGISVPLAQEYTKDEELREFYGCDQDNSEDDFNQKQVNLEVLFNDTYADSIPIVINLISNAILRSFGEKDMINTSSQSLPAVRGALKFDATTFTAPMMIGLTFTIISAGLGIECVYDREIMARSILRLNGVGFNSYFMSYFVVLGAIYMVSYLGLLIVIAAFQVPSLIIPQAFAAIAILYLLYIPCSLLYSVVFCYIFDKSETARQFYPNMCTTVGMVAYTIVSLVDILVVGIDKDNKSSLIVHTVFTVVLPNYIPFGLMYFINKVYIDCSVKGNCGDLTFDNYFTPEIVVLFVVVLIDIPFYYILLRIADTLKFGGSWREALWMKESKVGTVNEINEQGIDAPAGEDDDVKEERTNVAAAMRDGDRSSPVLIYDLGKVFNKGTAEQRNSCKKKKAEAEFVALKSVSLKVKAGEVFGLLGPNGAGKTTCLRVMTAEKEKVQICGEDVSSSISSAFAAMGYCPQHDALWRNLTVAEHIEVFAEIRGVHKDQVKPLIDTYLQGLEIEEHRKKMVKACSGGTKRKLSYILSMLGCPQVVLLDEPSTGMDPQSKRFLWNSILASFKGDRSAILTTHSMEEADALCSRIGILVKGGMRCVGAIQHLKNKYGGGYTVEMKLKCDATNVEEVNSPSSGSSVELMNDVTAMLKEVFPRGVLDEQFGERIIYKVPQDDISSLSKCFEMLEKAKADGLVEEYALSQTTLEQVFLKFARQQEFEDDDEEVSTPQTSLSTTHL
ncbi:cholesterol transporter ABCA5-like [Homarus americanus]|uniref:cholesterol transporter ABCA5-like n=1 Tax=Homarus americanus TaxID=6706 RepID=UPI001C46682F|nr:cholesterol transporter ABCA5-like [Homarus americanus]